MITDLKLQWDVVDVTIRQARLACELQKLADEAPNKEQANLYEAMYLIANATAKDMCRAVVKNTPTTGSDLYAIMDNLQNSGSCYPIDTWVESL